jgi:bifunctional non-homologous end joining protein LigD
VGYYADEGGGPALRYAARVGSGFTEDLLRKLAKQLEPRHRKDSPFEGRQPPKEANFVDPELVCQVEFREWTAARTLRAPVFKGLREDKDPSEVTIELPQPPPSGS